LADPARFRGIIGSAVALFEQLIGECDELGKRRFEGNGKLGESVIAGILSSSL
jgi:hypothetical protein